MSEKPIFLLRVSITIISTIIILSLCQHQGWTEGNFYVNEKLGFSIEGPEEWHMVSSEELLEKMGVQEKDLIPMSINFYKYPFDFSNEPNPGVGVMVESATSSTVWEYAEKAINFDKEFSIDYNILDGPKEIVLNGQKGVRVESEGYMIFRYSPTGEKEGFNFISIRYFFLKDEMCYSLSIMDDSKNFENNRSDFKKAINSFKLR